MNERGYRGWLAGLAVVAGALGAGADAGRDASVADGPGVPVVAPAAEVRAMTSSRLAGGFGWMVPYIGYDPDTEAGPGRPIEYIPPMALPGEMAPVPGYEAADVFAAAAEWPAQLSREELERVYELAGVPVEWREEASAVACGHGNVRFPSGESNCRPMAVGDAGNSLGLFQLNAETWAPYCGVAADELFDPVINARCAVSILRYEERRGYDRWSNWTVKP